MIKRAPIVLGVILLFSFGNSFAQATSATQLNYLDSLMEEVSNQVEVFENAAHTYKNAHLALKLALQSGNDTLMAKAYFNLADWHYYQFHLSKSPDSILYYNTKALAKYTALQDTVAMMETYDFIHITYIGLKQYDLAERVDFKYVAIAEASKNNEHLGLAFTNLAEVYTHTNELKSAISYADKGIDVLKLLDDKTSLGLAYFSTSETFERNRDYPRLLAHGNEAINIFESLGHQEDIFTAYGIRGTAHMHLERYEEALTDLMLVLSEGKKYYGDSAGGQFAHYVGETYLEQGSYLKALPYLEEGLTYALDFNDDSYLLKSYETLAKCYKKLGRFSKALEYTELARTQADSIQEQRIRGIQSELLVRYETAEKEGLISTQSAMIAQQQKMQYLYLAVAVLLSATLLGLYYYYKQRQAQNQKLQQLNAELATRNQQNELLLKEIHHRVKNNLELVKSLIALQSAQLEDSPTKDAMIASQNRVESMGIIHQKLYQGENLGSVEMKDYFLNLGEGILDAFSAEEKVKIECAMDSLELDVDTAVPIGLIVNELLTNALKYAFPKNIQGTICISLSRTDAETLTLCVTDNGVGKSAGLAPQGTGFGSQLIQLLTQQLNGQMQEESQEGTRVSFQFHLDQAA